MLNDNDPSRLTSILFSTSWGILNQLFIPLTSPTLLGDILFRASCTEFKQMNNCVSGEKGKTQSHQVIGILAFFASGNHISICDVRENEARAVITETSV
ncbi:hypothetical protein CDAR_11101 [Caerostris darwini]|uniref:Uncharacterized protein n=1 Tax=Caerostris darwini TaxID=1538125 RepID=A0AAV4VW27_9ARAC|nr:hypothetical protein CDAR_11101 [Caerostris darwini]